MAIYHTGGVFSYLPHHLDLARLGWSQYMHECVGASQGYHGVRVGALRVRVLPRLQRNPHTGGANNHTYPTAKNPPTTPHPNPNPNPNPMIALRCANTLMHVL